MAEPQSTPPSQDVRFPLLAQQILKQDSGDRWLDIVLQYLKQHPDQDSELHVKANEAKRMIQRQRSKPRCIAILGPRGVPRVALAAGLVADADVDPDPESKRSYESPQLQLKVSPLPSLNYAKKEEIDRQQVLHSAVQSDYTVLLLTTPWIQDELRLVEDYARLIGTRSVKTGALLLLDESYSVDRTEVEGDLKRFGVPLIAVARKQHFTDLVAALSGWLDPQLAASIYCPGGVRTPSMRPGTEKSTLPNDNDLDLLGGLRAKLGGIETDLIEPTRCCNEFDSDADAGAKEIAHVRGQLQAIDNKFLIAENRWNAQQLMLKKLKAAATGSTGASDPGSLPYPAPKMEIAASEVFDAGWQPTYCASICNGAVVDTDGLWLIRKKGRDALVKRSQDNAFKFGDDVIKHWILGEDSIPKAPRSLHAEICYQIEANYLWIQQQWTQHQLRGSDTPKAPANLADDVKRALTHGIDTSTEAIASAGWAIVTGAAVGSAVGAGAGVVAAKFAIIPASALAAPIVIAAGVVGVLGYSYWAHKTRDKIIAAVQTRLQKAVDAKREQVREMFRMAAADQFHQFSCKVQDALHLENRAVADEISALDQEREKLRRRMNKLTGEREEKKKQVKDRRQKLENDRASVLGLLNQDYPTAVGEKPR
jgi:predicted phage tail protein